MNFASNKLTGNGSQSDKNVANVEVAGNSIGIGAGTMGTPGYGSVSGYGQDAMNQAKDGTSYVGNAAGAGANQIKSGGTNGYRALGDGITNAGAITTTNPFDMDTSNIMKLDEAKGLFNAQFNEYLSLDFEAFMNIIPVDYYGPITKLLLNFFLFLPGFFSFYTIKMFHDSIFTMISLSIFIFVGLTFIHYQIIDEKIWYFIALKNFNHDFKARIKTAVIVGAGSGVTLAAILILYFTFIPFGPTEIAMQMPYMQNYYDLLYWAVFTVFFVGVLPVCEVLFFVIFQANVWFRASAQIKIAAFYAFYHFGWLCEVVGNWYSIVVLTALSFVVCIWLIKLMGRDDVFKCITIRVGLSLAVWALLVYLYFQAPQGKTKLPSVAFLRGSPNNIFMKY